LVVLSCLFLSCKSPDKKKGPANSATDPAFIQLPAAGELDAAIQKKYQTACAQWYDSILKNTGFNGAVLVAKNGHIVFEKYQGLGHLNGQDSINAQTVFHIASVTKTFTAMAVLKLWQEGKLNIDDELSVYFPGFNYPGVKVRTLLNHRSGLPNYLYFMEDLGWDNTKFITNQDVYDYLVNRKSEIKNIAKPGIHFTYCNTNYALLALLIEKVSGLTYPDYLSKNFFIPLQMKNSFVYTAADVNRITPSYDWRGQLIPANQLDMVYGDKNIYSTTHDLLRWDRLLATNLLFSKATLEEAFTPYSNEKPGIRNYGLGWRMNIYPDGKKTIYHNGWWHGNNACLIRLVNEDVTIIALGNRFNRNVYKAKYLVNIFGEGYDLQEDEEGEPAKSPARRMPSSPVTSSKKQLHPK
jgi:CubicO group peptidase (beta-lactamase class C family)